MIFKNMDGKLVEFPTTEADAALEALVREACAVELPREFAALNFSTGIEAWMRGVFACNAYIDEQAPWGLKKTDPERMGAVLLTLFKAIRDLSIAISPVVPTSASKVLDQLGVPAGERDLAALADGAWYARRVATGEPLGAPSPAFPRLELPAEDETA
jgi:methionyl-tRNA synthetase